MKDHMNEATLYAKALSGTVQRRREEAKGEQDGVEVIHLVISLTSYHLPHLPESNCTSVKRVK